MYHNRVDLDIKEKKIINKNKNKKKLLNILLTKNNERLKMIELKYLIAKI